MIRLSGSAQRDLTEIAIWTESRWGAPQKKVYLARLQAAFKAIAGSPDIGKRRDDVRPRLRSYAVERHVIFYEAVGSNTDVIRVLHQRIEAARHVSDD